MNVFILGTSTLAVMVAEVLQQEGHDVTLVDDDEEKLAQLPLAIQEKALAFDPTDEFALKRAGIDKAQAFLSLSDSDQRNILASQKVKLLFGISRVMCLVQDPARNQVYKDMGMETISPTSLMAEMVVAAIREM